mmetsp:Transcript_31498/g.72056  ORF Transcript_31498/g.72056 Transcript_31498/m.72056 type:complete len:160 (+) Transcript_31498:1-480(+)
MGMSSGSQRAGGVEVLASDVPRRVRCWAVLLCSVASGCVRSALLGGESGEMCYRVVVRGGLSLKGEPRAAAERPRSSTARLKAWHSAMEAVGRRRGWPPWAFARCLPGRPGRWGAQAAVELLGRCFEPMSMVVFCVRLCSCGSEVAVASWLRAALSFSL